MAVKVEETLADLRARLRTHLGFVTPAGNTLLQPKLLDEWLQRSQTLLWWRYAFPRLRTEVDQSTAAGQVRYDPPDNCDPRRVNAVTINEQGIWLPLFQGIEYDRDTFADDRAQPRQYDWIEDQLQMYPTPDKVYTYRLDYTKRPSAFTIDTHRASIDSDLIFWQAAVLGKIHYGRPADADQAMLAELARNLSQFQHAQHTPNRLRRRRYSLTDPYLRLPRMV